MDTNLADRLVADLIAQHERDLAAARAQEYRDRNKADGMANTHTIDSALVRAMRTVLVERYGSLTEAVRQGSDLAEVARRATADLHRRGYPDCKQQQARMLHRLGDDALEAHRTRPPGRLG